jgi:hypothetical protein
MKKNDLLLLLTALSFGVLAAGCASSGGLGYYNGSYVARMWYTDRFGLELSLAPSFNIYSYANKNDSSGYTYENSNGSTIFQAGVGIGFLCNIVNKSNFKVGVNLKYTDNVSIVYSYYESKQSDIFGNQYHNYSDSTTYNYANSHRFSVIFPEIEISLPFIKGLNLLASAEIYFVNWKNSGGYVVSNYSANASSTSYNEMAGGTFAFPGGYVGSESSGTNVTGIGDLKLGFLYYF